MDFITEVLDAHFSSREDNWGFVVRELSLRFSVDSKEVKSFPDSLEEFVHVPHSVGRDEDVIWDLVKEVEFLNSDLIDFIDDVEGGNVDSVAVNRIYEIIDSAFASEDNFGIVQFILPHDISDGLITHADVGSYSSIDHDTSSLVVGSNNDIRFLPVDSDADAF